MCGLFGLVFHADPTPNLVRFAKLFSYLAEGSAERGTDATGMARIDVDGYSTIYKNCQPSWEVVGYRRWEKLLCNVNPCTLALLGHTRYGTHGSNVIGNAHPFKFIGAPHESLVGTHNGMIFGHSTWGPENPFENDSANLFYGLSIRPKDEWTKMLEKVSGSFALAYSTPGMVHLTRNYGSPIELLYLEQYNVTIYASTWLIMQWALEKSGIDCTDVSRSMPSGELWTYTPECSVPIVLKYENDEDYFFYHNYSKRVATHSIPPRITPMQSWPSKATVEFDAQFTSDSIVECDRCATSIFWEEVTVPTDRDTCFWCKKCADTMLADDDVANYYSGIDPVICVECGREVRFQDTRIIGQQSVCLSCAGEDISSSWIQCDNCTSQYNVHQLGKMIHYLPELSTHLCVNCQDDPTNPFCVPVA